MPRITELVAHGFATADVQIPDVGPNGETQPDGAGGIKMRKAKQLVFIDAQTGDQTRVTLADDARAELIRQLTGGIVVANGKPALL